MESPDVQYARSGDLSIAYQVVVGGPVDLVLVPFLISPIFSWLHPVFASFYRRPLIEERRLLRTDRVKSCADIIHLRLESWQRTWPVRCADTALVGSGHGGLMCSLFAATYFQSARPH